jgi:hypothetical protein
MKANLRRLEAIQQAVESRKASQPTESRYSSWTTEELHAEMDRFMKNRTPEQKAYSEWLESLSLEELKQYYADMMREIT